MAKKKDDRGSPKLRPELYAEIGQFAASQGMTIVKVLEAAWVEYKQNNHIVIPPVQFEPMGIVKRKKAGSSTPSMA